MIAAALGLLVAAARPAPADAVEAALRAQMAEAHAPGAAFAVVRGSQVEARGLGVCRKGAADPVTADTVFMIGSVTKTLTTVAVLRAAEAKSLDLDGPLGRVLPGLDPAVADLTPRQLVSQTSGLGDLPGVAGPTNEGALAAFARFLRPKQFVAPPGAVFSYSNPGFALAGAALEAARSGALRRRHAGAGLRAPGDGAQQPASCRGRGVAPRHRP